MSQGAIPFEPCTAHYRDGRHHPVFTRCCSSAACGREAWRIGYIAEQEKRNDLAKAIAAAAAVADIPVPTSSWDFQLFSFDQYGAPGESTLEFLENFFIRIAMRAYCGPSAAPRRRFRVISYSIWSYQAHTVLARQPSTFAYPSPSVPS
jgi:hypothetical protein